MKNPILMDLTVLDAGTASLKEIGNRVVAE